MSGHVLIIDALSNRRIQLQALMDAACYRLDQAESQMDGLSRIKSDPPDVVIVAHDLPGLRLPQFCKALRLSPATRLTTVLVAVPSENHSARVAALIAGASDVIEYRTTTSELQARLRNFTRLRQMSEEVRLRSGPMEQLGFSEAQTAFSKQSVVALICADDTEAEHAKRFAESADFDLHILGANTAKRGLDPAPDVIVLFDAADPLLMRDVLGALRTQDAARHAAVLYVTRNHGPGTASPLDLGAQDLVQHSISDAELALRITRLAQRKQFEDRVRDEISTLGEKAYTDALTGLHNRDYADSYLHKQDRRLAEVPRNFAILMVDVDHFKQINDTHGHAAGDDILKHIATVLKLHLRDGDMIARYGGEEFLIALFGVGPNEARSVAERLRNEVAQQPKSITTGTHVRATVSLGLAFSRSLSGYTTREMRLAADNALYRAKAMGRNQIQIATDLDRSRRAYRTSIPAAKKTG